MKRIVLIDGNNLMFRSFYATAYSGNIMKNSKGLTTNALYGFANMINKIIDEEKPEYMAVAFDVGKSFRHREYVDYKAGRKETPDDLKKQMPYARTLLDEMGIFNINVLDFEADDIIGTISKIARDSNEWDILLVTSDHDYLQLIDEHVTVKLLQPKGFIKYNPNNFMDDYGIEPIRIIDLKALMGDSSDNIPGVSGIGEKTALKLLQEYQTLDNLYANIDNIKGKMHDKLIDNKDLAYFSYKLATIIRTVPLNFSLEDMKYNGPKDTLDDFYRELEFFSLIKKHENLKNVEVETNVLVLEDIKQINLDKEISYYIECDNENYHLANILGMGLYDGEDLYYVEPNMIKDVISYIHDVPKYTFELKKNMCLLNDTDLNTIFDLNLASYLLNKNTKDDLATLMAIDGITVPFIHDIIKNKLDVKNIVTLKAKYIYDVHSKYVDDLKSEEMYELYTNIEHPLIIVLAKMELTGMICNKKILDEMKAKSIVEIEKLKDEIYSLCGMEFNISSPKQLADVLFNKMGLKHGKKINTSAETLEKIVDEHPVITKILEYRNLTKIHSTYLEGLEKYIMPDGRIHTIFKQTLTRTGRLSSVDPNLQNIPARSELGKLVRKAFVPINDVFLSCDYSQIELRILAHISESQDLIDAFVNGEDIHTKVASDIFNKPQNEITPNERRTAKAVIFGIVYGISGFGLGENIGVSPKDAKKFIDKYLEIYPGVKNYMDLIVKDAYSCGYVRTLYNRKRNIDELFSSNYMVRQSGERIALNTPIQGTSADIIKKAMVEIDKAFVANGIMSRMVLQIHDELIFDCLESEKDKVADIVKTIMESTVKLSVPLKVSQDFGTDLYETK